MSCNCGVEKSSFESVLQASEAESVEELNEASAENTLNESSECIAAYEDTMNRAGLNLDLLRAEEARDLQESDSWVQDSRRSLISGAGQAESAALLGDDEFAESRELGLQPEGFTALTPEGCSEISSDNQLQAWLPSGGCKDYWMWAKGGGWGCTGGVASRLRYVDWWFRYTPRSNKHYAIRPYVKFRGFYITRANDKWYNCKHARGRVQIKVNAFQYNWKGESTWTVLDSHGDNINRNRRFDTTRSVNYSALLGGGDTVHIRVRVALYVRSKGSGSYSELNFATGNANYMCVPHLWIG